MNIKEIAEKAAPIVIRAFQQQKITQIPGKVCHKLPKLPPLLHQLFNLLHDPGKILL